MQTSVIDQENTNSAVATHGRLGSMAAGRQVAKTFGGSSAPLATPRRALGELSNDPSKKGLGSSTFGKKLLNTGDGSNIVFKKAVPSQMGPVFKKPSITTPSLQGLTSKKKPLRLKQEGTTKKSAALKMSEVVPSVFEDVFPDVENMHIFDEEKYSSTPAHLPDSECLSKFLDRIGFVRAPLIHHAKMNDTDRDFSHLQIESNSRRENTNFEDPIISSSSSSSVFDLPSGAGAMSLHSCLLDLPPVESVDFMDLNNIPDFLD
ncbi:uncharacterized protein [Amphiura filiformis]|uniref:uncharacterized protein n=1 Tax=Amphiura filiformis TaxID=82378 RepID=UPI003B218CA2